MVTSKLQQLQKYKQKVATLESQLEKERQKLLKLPAKLGFNSVGALIEALQVAAKDSLGRESVAILAKGRRKRAVITAETKAGVKKLAGQGKRGREIAEALGISLPSVQNIKRELGLVKKRG